MTINGRDFSFYFKGTPPNIRSDFQVDSEDGRFSIRTSGDSLIVLGAECPRLGDSTSRPVAIKPRPRGDYLMCSRRYSGGGRLVSDNRQSYSVWIAEARYPALASPGARAFPDGVGFAGVSDFAARVSAETSRTTS